MDINKYKNYKIKIIENVNNSKLDYLFSKILVVGDCNVGKSSLIKKITTFLLSPKLFFKEYFLLRIL